MKKQNNKTEQVAQFLSEHGFDGMEVNIDWVSARLKHIDRTHIAVAMANLRSRGALTWDGRTTRSTKNKPMYQYRISMPELRRLKHNAAPPEGVRRERKKSNAKQVPVKTVPNDIDVLRGRVKRLENLLEFHFGPEFFVEPDGA